MTKELEGKVAVVTGASEGIGKACAIAMLEASARVVPVARNLQKLNDIYSGFGDAAISMAADLLKAEDRRALVTRVLEKTGQIDIFHANAGGYIGGDLVENDPEVIEQVLDLNVKAAIRNIRDVLPHMIERKTGHVIVTSSIAGLRHPNYEPVYGPSKAAVERFAELTRTQVSKHGVRVSSISPGPVETALVANWEPERLKEDRAAKGFLDPKEVADAFMFIVTRPPHNTISKIEITPTAFRRI